MNRNKMPPRYTIQVQYTIDVYDEAEVSVPRMVAVTYDMTQDELRFWTSTPPTEETVNEMVIGAIGEADSRCSRTYYMPTQPLTMEDVRCYPVYVMPLDQIKCEWKLPGPDILKLYERTLVCFMLPRQIPRPPLM